MSEVELFTTVENHNKNVGDDDEVTDDEYNDNDDMGSIIGSDEEEETEYTVAVKEMLTVYERKIKVKSSIAVKADLLRFVRRLVIPQVKFISEGSALGSFERPDFSNKNCWQSVILNKAGYGSMSPRGKAKIWVTYCKDIAEAFSNHRSNVTARMKKAFLAGKCYCTHCIFVLKELHSIILNHYIILVSSNWDILVLG